MSTINTDLGIGDMPELWMNPLFSLEDRFQMARGGVRYQKDILLNIRQQLKEANEKLDGIGISCGTVRLRE